MRLPNKASGKGWIAVVAFILMMTASCVPENIIWTDTYHFPGTCWKGDYRISFKPDSAFLSARCRDVKGVLSMRYGMDASVEDIPMVVEMEYPSEGRFFSDTIRFNLLTAERRTANNATTGIFESVYNINLPLTPSPGWNITFYPASEHTEIRGLYTLTFELLRNEK